MITNQSLAELIERKLNGARNDERGEYENIHKYGLDRFTPNVRYEFKIFADDGEYKRAENRGMDYAEVTNTVTQYINGVLKTPGGSAVEGAGVETYNAAIEAEIELLIPNCDDVATFQGDGDESYTRRLQDAVQVLVKNELGIPTDDYIPDGDDVLYFVGTRYRNGSVGDRRHRTQTGLSVILSLYVSFAVVAMGISSRKIALEIDGEKVYFSRLSLSRTSTQENNVVATDEGADIGVARARTTATQLVIGFSAPVRPTGLNRSLIRYILLGEVKDLAVKISVPVKLGGGEELIESNYTMVFAEGGIAGEENLNAAYDIRLVEKMRE